MTDHLRNVWQKQSAKEVGGFSRNLSRHVVNGADQHTTTSKAEQNKTKTKMKDLFKILQIKLKSL